MRYRVPQEAFADRRLQGNDLRVLLAIASHAKPDGSCWPAQGTIAERLGMHRPNVNRSVGRLEGFGYLFRVGRSGYRSCLYYLTVPTDADDDTQTCITGDTQTPSENYSPPIVPPQGDIAASADADRSPVRRRKRRKERGGGQEAATPPPGPRPSDRGGGALVPADIPGAARAIARQAAKCMNRATAPPPVTPCQRAMTHTEVMTRDMAYGLWKRAGEVGEAQACEEFGFTKFGRWKEGKP